MKTLKVVITGGDGQLGQSLMALKPNFPKLELIARDIHDADITNRKSLSKTILLLNPDFIVNCAAFTAVDKAENNEESALLVNRNGPENLAFVCKDLNIPLIHISTDYVFSGDAKTPYKVTDPTGPVTAYGRSKLAGEEAIFKSGVKGLIIRTSWLYSEFGHNFVKSIIKLGLEKEEISVVNDQLGSPTYAGDLANTILQIIIKISSDQALSDNASIYHFSNSGSCTWYDLAIAIMEISKTNCKVNPVSTAQFQRAAKRPAYSVMDISKIENDFKLKVPVWRNSLITCLGKIKK